MNVRCELDSLRAWLERVTPTDFVEHLPQLDVKLHDLLGVVRHSDLEIYFAVCGRIYDLTASLKVPVNVLSKFNEISTLIFRLSVGEDSESATVNLSDECALHFNTAIERLLTNLPYCPQIFLQQDSMPIIAHTFSMVLGVLRNPQDNTDGVSFLIESGDCLESLCRTLVRFLTFDLDGMRVSDQFSVELADPPSSEVAPVVPVNLFQKFFKYFRQPAIVYDAERVVIALTSTCKFLRLQQQTFRCQL
ncbi:unnamed protein product [Dibothriocephalus latus]|uniref:Uncharacterized protein n=1 Tax=Dibothriocephalus latus TaxID=60516 RepID=A0A3P7M4K4_DIBLA|nr:unnamed protein product [Dibothriocephalus latus]